MRSSLYIKIIFSFDFVWILWNLNLKIFELGPKFRGTKFVQMKKSWTWRFLNSSRSSLYIKIIFSFDLVWILWKLNLKILELGPKFRRAKFVQMNKSWTWRILNSSRSSFFVKTIFSFDKVIQTLFTNFMYHSHSSMNYENDL